MALKEQLNDAMKQAMKAHDSLRLSAVRMIRSAIQNREIDLKRELDDPGVIDVISSMVKQRRESIRLYQKGNRQDLFEQENSELDILTGFLPVQLSAAEIGELVTQVIRETGVMNIKDMGRIMKALTPLTAGRADGKMFSDIVRKQLS